MLKPIKREEGTDILGDVGNMLYIGPCAGHIKHINLEVLEIMLLVQSG